MKVLLLEPGAEPPRRAHSQDAGFDLFAATDLRLEPGARALVPTGVAIGLDQGQVAMVCPRSGLALHHGVTVLNAPGIVDAGYRGEVKVVLLNTSDEAWDIAVGDRIAQLVVTAVDMRGIEVVDALDDTSRAAAGFGSSGS